MNPLNWIRSLKVSDLRHGWQFFIWGWILVIASNFTMMFGVSQELFDTIRFYYVALPALLLLVIGTITASRVAPWLRRTSVIVNGLVVVIVGAGYIFHLLELHVALGISLFAELALLATAQYTVLIIQWKQRDTTHVPL